MTMELTPTSSAASSPSRPLLEQDDNSRHDTFLRESHYTTWHRMVRNSSRLHVSVLKFLYNLFVFTGETGCLVLNLITGIVIPTEDSDETAIAVGLYLVTCFVSVLVNYCNERSTRKHGQDTTTRTGRCTSFLFRFVGLLKPCRYYVEYKTVNEKHRIITQESTNSVNGEKLITQRGLQALCDLNEQQLEDKKVELYESYFQSIPMSLVQNYFLFSSFQKFQLCAEDLTRLGLILFSTLQAAKAAAAYESAKADFEASTHFLSFYKSKGAHPMRIDHQNAVSFAGVLNLLNHVTSIASRFYVTSYLLVISPVLSVIFVLSVFLSTIAVVSLFPYDFYEVHENAPFGVPLAISWTTDRLVNIFSPVSTRFTKFSYSKFCGLRFPLVLVQIPIIIFSLGVVYASAYGLQITDNPRKLTVTSNDTIEDVLNSCPQLEEWYGLNNLTRVSGEWMFGTYKSLNDRFVTFGDVFGVGNLIWLLCFINVVVGVVSAYAVKEFKLTESFPAVTAYSFWGTLIDDVLASGGGGGNNNNRNQRLRALMVLTGLRAPEFYTMTRICGIFNKRGLSCGEVDYWARFIVGKLSESDSEVDAKIADCFRVGHLLDSKFREVYHVLVGRGQNEEGKVNKRLFFYFFCKFDLKVCSMSSHRVGRVFDLLRVGKVKTL